LAPGIQQVSQGYTENVGNAIYMSFRYGFLYY